MGTEPFHLHRRAAGNEARRFSGPAQGAGNGRIADFRRGAAALADQKLVRVVVLRVARAIRRMLQRIGAADEGVQPLHLVDQPMLDQEIKRAVYGGRRRAGPTRLQPIQQRISPQRLVGHQDQPQHLPPEGGELGAAPGTKRGGLIQAGIEGGFRKRGHSGMITP